MNDVEKAQKLLTDSVINRAQISRQTGISQVALSNYATGKRDLKRAPWINVHKLAKLYDAIQMAETFMKKDTL